MILEKAALYLFSSRVKSLHKHRICPEEIQSEQFIRLIKAASHTEWGEKYDYKGIRSYKDFIARVPVQDYESVKPFINRMMQGEENILWPEKIRWFAQSSGTTNDKSKHIPVSLSSIKLCHYRGPMDSLTCYLKNVPESRIFSGKGLILGGSHRTAPYNKYVHAGDLSAILIENMPSLANFFRVPSKDIILMNEWESKLEAICRETIHKNVTNISGVPSWVLVLIKKILQDTGKSYLTEVWPNLELFIHGGVSFTPYSEQYKHLIPSPRMRYMETYNASEGFFSIQNDFDDPSMLLMLDYGIFYEFIPVEDFQSDNPQTISLEEVELNRNYALVISSTNGLWRYKIGDTVKFTSKSPYKIIVTGRTRHFINAFGEELMIDNAEKAVCEACQATGAKIREYTAAPVYMSAELKGKHQWLIEFEVKPDSIGTFVQILDDTLKKQNSDYEAKRYKNMTLDVPELTIAREGLFYDWLATKGKLGGQHKIPRLSNNREIIESILSLD